MLIIQEIKVAKLSAPHLPQLRRVLLCLEIRRKCVKNGGERQRCAMAGTHRKTWPTTIRRETRLLGFRVRENNFFFGFSTFLGKLIGLRYNSTI